MECYGWKSIQRKNDGEVQVVKFDRLKLKVQRQKVSNGTKQHRDDEKPRDGISKSGVQAAC